MTYKLLRRYIFTSVRSILNIFLIAPSAIDPTNFLQISNRSMTQYSLTFTARFKNRAHAGRRDIVPGYYSA